MNLKRHQISFEQGEQVFDDPFHVVVDDCETDEGMRYHAIGYAGGHLLAVVVFLDQTKGENLHYHLISARKAEFPEEQAYAQQFN